MTTWVHLGRLSCDIEVASLRQGINLSRVLLEAMAQVSQAIMKAGNVHRERYPVGMLCSMI